MKVKIMMLVISFFVVLNIPIPVQAVEAGEDTIGGITVVSEPEIEILTSEEAEKIFRELEGNSAMTPWSVMASSKIRVSEGDNKIYVVYSTGSRQIADRVGVRNVTFQEKSGLFWKTLSIHSEYSDNTDTHFGGFSMTNPIDGAKYRASCTHYVIINGQETSGYNETLPHTYSNE